jgi:hypothetical protein
VSLSKRDELLQNCLFAVRFTNFDSSIFSHEAFDNVTILISVRGPWCASVLLWVMIQFSSAIFKFVASHRHLLPAESVLATNIHWLGMNLADSLLMHAKIWPPRWPYSWNSFQSRGPFRSLLKFKHMRRTTPALLLYPTYRCMQVKSRCRVQGI